MKTLLRLLATFLLASAIWSCHTAKSASAKTEAQASVAVADTSTAAVNRSFVSLIDAARDVQLAGITVEFFPPDTLRPAAPPAPKSLSIQKAVVSEAAVERSEVWTSVELAASRHMVADSTATAQSTLEAEGSALSPHRWAGMLVLVAIVCGLVLAIRRRDY